MRIVYTISPCSCMFMYPCFLSISPYCYVYVSKVLTLFHHTIVYYVSKLFILFLMCQDFLLYFTILICYVSKLFILFLMCQNFLLYFIISIMYVYVSAFVYYFTVHINRARYVSILICYFTIHYCMFMYPCFLSISPYCYVYVSKVLTLFHHTVCILCIQAFYPVSYVSGLFTLFHYTLCVYVSMFLFYFTIYINHICYVSKLLTLFHHINFHMFMYPYIHVFAYEH